MLDPSKVDIFVEKGRPSQAYHQARATLVYRLSEATFASLLATYIIGFFSFLAPIWRPNETLKVEEAVNRLREEVVSRLIEERPEMASQQLQIKKMDVKTDHKRLPDTISLISVSLVFSFMTAAIYLIYNQSVLTMASYNEAKGSRDFAFAVSQGGLFGWAIVYPTCLTFVTGVILIVGAWIKYMEHGRLVVYIQEKLFPCPNDQMRAHETDVHKAKSQKEIQIVVSDSKIPEWQKPAWWYVAGLVGMIFAGLAMIFVDLFCKMDCVSYIVLVFNGVLTFVVVIWSYVVISKDADFMRPGGEDKNGIYNMDSNFEKFVESLKTNTELAKMA